MKPNGEETIAKNGNAVPNEIRQPTTLTMHTKFSPNPAAHPQNVMTKMLSCLYTSMVSQAVIAPHWKTSLL